MSTKKSNTSRKDPLKTPKVWERARREKMKIFFNELQEVLPFYDPSTPMSRFEILQKSKAYIKDLQDQNQDLLNGGFDEVYKIKMTKLKQRVKELLKRVDQLTDLLRTANIMIPPLEAYPEGLKTSNSYKWINQRPKKWTEKINLVVPDEKIKSVLTLIKDYKKNSGKMNLKRKQIISNSDKAEIGVASESCLPKTVTRKKKLLKKNNKVITLKGKDNNLHKGDSFIGSQSPSQFKENQPVDFNLLSVSNSSTVKESDPSISTSFSIIRSSTESTSHQTVTSSISNVTISQKCIETHNQPSLILPPAANVLQSNTFILTNDGNLVQLPILSSSGTVFSANSNLLTPTIMKSNTGLLTPLVINKPSPVIVVQKPPPQIIQTAQIINTAPQVIGVSKPSVQILNGSVLYTSSNSTASIKTLPHILSKAPTNKKRIARDSTVTTYVNKIPIPALSKQSYAKKGVTANVVNTKEKCSNVKSKTTPEKVMENDKEDEVSQNNESAEEKNNQSLNEKSSTQAIVQEKSKICENVSGNSQKRELVEEKSDNTKKQKLEENLLVNSEGNVFKPIENDADGMFCNLTLPNSINPSLSVSPTAAFLSSFPIVAATRSEAEEEIAERKSEENKDPKPGRETQTTNLEKSEVENTPVKERSSLNVSRQCLSEKPPVTAVQIQTEPIKEKLDEVPKEHIKISSSNSLLNSNASSNKNNLNHEPLDNCKSWEQFHHENCEMRSETFYLQPDNTVHINDSVASVVTVSNPIVSFPGTSNNNLNNSPYNTYPQNSASLVKTNHVGVQSTLNEVPVKNNLFEYSQKETYANKVVTYNSDRSVHKKQCCNNVGDSYNVSKTQPSSYQMDSGPNYQLIPAKEVSSQRNSRTVNWMTEPDVRNRTLAFGSQNNNDKMTSVKTSVYTQSDNFYMNNQTIKPSGDCSGHFDQSKVNYQKNNDFYVKEQRCKPLEKRTETKSYTKTPQNTYNIFDYNYTGNCYGEDDSNKYCNVHSYTGKTKKNITQSKKKTEDVHHEQTANDPTKRLQDQIITNVDFNPIANQEYFAWVPGKNVDWLPSKSFGLDSNLVVPSTLPTLVGDLALGTTSTNDINQTKNLNSKICQPNGKSNSNEIPKDYIDLGMSNNPTLPKPMEGVDNNPNKQYLEPFANLSKNIFDITPSNAHNPQMLKNDFDKINFTGSNSNETIVLKNIFELPVSKSSGPEFSRNKQRAINSSQNTFLSVSQLVEPPSFDSSSMKSDNSMEPAGVKDLYTQNYSTYNNQKTYKNKSRSSHCKYNDRKYHGCKNGSSSYTAEALIRSNTNVNYQTNDFVPDINPTFFNGKPNQKPDQFPANNKIDFEINMKSDFTTGPNQNLYSDFNFSSPVPNFSIAPTVGTDFGSHEAGGNFSTQNNSFFGDFITPEYSLTDNVSNSLLLPPCSISLQNPFVIDKRNIPVEKTKNNSKQYSTPRNRKHYDCSKTSYNDFSIPSTSAIFTTSNLSCPTIFTTSACQTLLSVPTQSIPISFSSPSFTTSNITFPPLSNTNTNYHRFPNSSQNSTSGSFLPSNTMFTTCASKPLSSSQNCYSSNPLPNVTNSVISSSFPVGNVSFSGSSQSTIPFFSLSNPIIPSSAPTSSSNSLANFNLSTIFPEINQKGNYQYS